MRAMCGVGLGMLAFLLAFGPGAGNVAARQGNVKPPEGPKGADLVKELDKVRAELQKARQEAEEQRKIAAQERERAEQIRREIEQALIQAKEEAEKARYLAQVALAEKEFAQKVGKEKALDVKAALEQLDREKAAVLKKFEVARANLARQLQMLDVQQKQILTDIEARKGELLGRAKEKPGGEAKLDTILQRLDALEKRLDRIEKGKPQGPKKSKKKE